MAGTRSSNLGDYAVDAVFRGLVGALHTLPYERRLRAMSWITRRAIGPLAGYRRRAVKNLGFVYPDMALAERRAIAERVLDSVGRTVIENYSRDEFRARIAQHDIGGPGLQAAEEARAAGRTIIFSSGHWSNHEATRTALDLRGFKVGGLYKPMANPYFNEHYVESISTVSGPAFPKSKEGTREFMKFLAEGGHGFLLHDVYFERGSWLKFLGKPAKTALSAAELAIRFDAVLIPYFNTRRADGVSFDIELCAPIPHGEPLIMMRTLVDLLEDKIAADPTQWLWFHRRWKTWETAPEDVI